MNEFNDWLARMAEEPLPGGVAAAVVAAAMGAALVAKAARVTLKRGGLPGDGWIDVEELLRQAGGARQMLLELAAQDEKAYRAVLQTGTAEALQAAIEAPRQIARVCARLLERLPALEAVCWPAVRPDLAVGRDLLVAGERAGSAAAEANRRLAKDPHGA
jgi:formiminotetrahydrofolate cyclodeaminase